MLKIKTPIKTPTTIGSKNLKLFFMSLKKYKMLFNNFSYIPKITQKTPLLIPGKIAPAPIAIPLKHEIMKCIYNTSIIKIYEDKEIKILKNIIN